MGPVIVKAAATVGRVLLGSAMIYSIADVAAGRTVARFMREAEKGNRKKRRKRKR